MLSHLTIRVHLCDQAAIRVLSGDDIVDAFGRLCYAGAVPSNLLQIPKTESNSHYLRTCNMLGRESHPARFPPDLP